MLSCPAALPLSSHSLNHLAERIRTHRRLARSRWRRLTPGRQALLVLAHLRNGDTYTRLAAGFGIGVATAWRYVQEVARLRYGAQDAASITAELALVFQTEEARGGGPTAEVTISALLCGRNALAPSPGVAGRCRCCSPPVRLVTIRCC